MAIIALASGARHFLERHLSKGDRSPTQIAVIAVLGIVIAAIAKYPDRAMFTRARPDLKDKTVPGWPLLGNLPEGLLEKRNQLYVIKSGFDQAGDVFSLTIPLRGRIIAINNPELIEYILKTNFNNFIKGETLTSQLIDILGSGIFVSDGDEWRLHRKTAVGVFTTKMYRQVTEGSFTLGARSLCSVLDKNERLGRPMDLQALFLKQTLDVFGKLTFGIEFNALNTEGPHEFENAFDFLLTNIDSRIMNPFWQWTDHLVPGKIRKIKSAIATLDKYAYVAIEKRKNESEADKEKRPKDLLDHFINHVDEDGNKLTDQQLRDVFVSFMLAGRDTTGYTLSWQFYSLLASPRILKNVLKELDSVLRGSEKYTYETMMNELPYLKAVFHETLRLYPAVPRNIKEVVNDDVLPDGTIVYKDDKIIFSTWSMGRNKSVWGVDAEDFVPERWLVEDEVSSPAHSTVTPSGHGVSPFGKFRMENMFKFNSFNCNPRLCLGQTFATLQAMVTTCMLLQNFDMTLVPGQPNPEPKPSAGLPMLRPLMVYASRKVAREPRESTTPLSASYIEV
ncbi:cytochrome P450-dit2 [Mortierella sp. AD011]|nr:cytochrome P450-dit2 [Mortierella sp. AD010]KAF9400101.1 cytochrome P450-dit2 [Mortierella sp. AD011]